MYCMRYFVPLLLLPFPDAPPIFVILFLVSFFLHQKPCIYCTLLLIALFSSTCYWGQGRCWIDLHQSRLFDVRQDSNATFGQGDGWWNYKVTLPIGQLNA
ncbi:hypothetical protein BDB00DRAFT_816461 [Zychaea mexicana]|uniref:uncharacterized protein n=1 Tax=Zychaea mexicana TaxID=64656 RepID=UPI0022FED69C|nr:uncharacterized protein BDB00DRAFT_816461 [Zychaea mexicana]KAI9494963.1 hypothetical protein BDB00DRAFT_816461 [Zychaea mexicana]